MSGFFDSVPWKMVSWLIRLVCVCYLLLGLGDLVGVKAAERYWHEITYSKWLGWYMLAFMFLANLPSILDWWRSLGHRRK